MRAVGGWAAVSVIVTRAFGAAFAWSKVRLPAALWGKSALAGFAVPAGTAIIAAEFFASIVGASAPRLTATATATCLLLRTVIFGGWRQRRHSFAEAFGKTERDCAYTGQALDVLHVAALVTGHEAVRLGIAQWVQDNDEVDDFALTLAEQLAALAPSALSAAKQCVTAARNGTGFELEIALTRELLTQDDTTNRLQDFLAGNRKR